MNDQWRTFSNTAIFSEYRPQYGNKDADWELSRQVWQWVGIVVVVDFIALVDGIIEVGTEIAIEPEVEMVKEIAANSDLLTLK